jgi:hypothetical protein
MAELCCLVGMCLGGTTVALFRVRERWAVAGTYERWPDSGLERRQCLTATCRCYPSPSDRMWPQCGPGWPGPWSRTPAALRSSATRDRIGRPGTARPIKARRTMSLGSMPGLIVGHLSAQRIDPVGRPRLTVGAARQAMRRGCWAIKALLAKEAGGGTLGPMGTRWQGRGGRPRFRPLTAGCWRR